jgi:flavin reductase (DIM6/NTAB) family NADH-FMN oxidoreductase RutF
MSEPVYPAQAILVTTRGNAEVLGREVAKDNIITMAWHCKLSFDPNLYGISVGKTRFSCKLIKESKVFAINFIAHELQEKAVFCGSSSGESIDKFEKTGLTKEECESIDCCRIKEASAVLECEVIDEFDVGDHVFFVGKVSNTLKNDDKKRLLYSGEQQFTSTIR